MFALIFQYKQPHWNPINQTLEQLAWYFLFLDNDSMNVFGFIYICII